MMVPKKKKKKELVGVKDTNVVAQGVFRGIIFSNDI